MRLSIVAAVAAVLIAGSVQAGSEMAPMASGPTCIQSELIDHTHTVNPKTVLFYMRGGKVWQNDLQASCSGLAFHGFTVIGHNSEICGGSGISVIETHQVCQLGKFTAYVPPVKTTPAP